MKKLADLRDEIAIWRTLEKKINDTLELAELEDPALQSELASETTAIQNELNNSRHPPRKTGIVQRLQILAPLD